jgi:hypothetical protein
MSKCSINTTKIAKKYLEKQEDLSDLEKVVLLYTYYNDLLEDIDQEDKSDVDLEDQIVEEWVGCLFGPQESDINLQLAAMSIAGSKT